MKLKSFVRDGLGLAPIEVELTLAKGLPGIKFLGLPDHLIKESEIRIQTAIRQQGFELPPAQTILVQLRPMEGRKTSHGLDLAIAAGFLWMTEQAKRPENFDGYVYGELDFQGKVYPPTDILDVLLLPTIETLMTGSGSELTREHFALTELKNLSIPKFKEERKNKRRWIKPSIEGWSVPFKLARLLSIAAVGEHHLLLAGPPGTGKSTAASLLTGLISEPWPNEVHQIDQIARFFGEKQDWRPVRRPHHTASQLALVGGTGKVLPGEVTKAHGGVLVLDELLEFDSKVQETLREPIETGTIRLSRGVSSADYPARFILIATTNLCPCGQLVPKASHKCRCQTFKRRKYVEKMSGPFLERFSLIGLADEWGGEPVPVVGLEKEVLTARNFQEATRNQLVPNQMLGDSILKKMLSNEDFKAFSQLMPSRRRVVNWLRVARSIADLAQSEKVTKAHLQEAWDFSELGVRKLSIDLQKYS
jgi:magnesium chelatase family protein